MRVEIYTKFWRAIVYLLFVGFLFVIVPLLACALFAFMAYTAASLYGQNPAPWAWSIGIVTLLIVIFWMWLPLWLEHLDMRDDKRATK